MDQASVHNDLVLGNTVTTLIVRSANKNYTVTRQGTDATHCHRRDAICEAFRGIGSGLPVLSFRRMSN